MPRLVRPAPVVASVQSPPTAPIVAYVQRVASAQLLMLCAAWPRLQSKAPAQPEQATEQAEAPRLVRRGLAAPTSLTMTPKHRNHDPSLAWSGGAWLLLPALTMSLKIHWPGPAGPGCFSLTMTPKHRNQ